MNTNAFKHDPSLGALNNSITYLNSLHEVPAAMEAKLRWTGVQYTQSFKRGKLLLQPDMFASKAYYINSGLVKLYVIGRDGDEDILHIWGENEVVILGTEFLEDRLNTRFFIEVMYDCELLVMPKENAVSIFRDFPEAHLLTEMILNRKSRKRISHMEILMLPPGERYAAMEGVHSEYRHMKLKAKLSEEELAAFLSVSVATISRSK